MRTFLKSILLIGAVWGFIGCTPSTSQLKKVMEENPEILFGVIEKHPDKFLEVVNKAAREAQARAQENEAKEAEKAREEEFKNPKKPEIQNWRAVLGEGPITIVEYSDFQCPFCKRGASTVKQVMDEYKGKVKFVFKHLPLDFHPAAMPAAQIFEAINMQDSGKAYKFHDIVFEQQDKLKGPDNGVKWMLEEAKKLGVDVAKVKKDMESEEVAKRIEADMEEAAKFGFQGTPGYLINGVSLRGAYPLAEFKKIIDQHLKN